jgi:hypothetical protein
LGAALLRPSNAASFSTSAFISRLTAQHRVLENPPKQQSLLCRHGVPPVLMKASRFTSPPCDSADNVAEIVERLDGRAHGLRVVLSVEAPGSPTAIISGSPAAGGGPAGKTHPEAS